jgi:hypothetical protein
MKLLYLQECHGDPCASQHRTVECSEEVLGCDAYTKPSIVRQCGNIHCGVWTLGAWSNVSIHTSSLVLLVA